VSDLGTALAVAGAAAVGLVLLGEARQAETGPSGVPTFGSITAQTIGRDLGSNLGRGVTDLLTVLNTAGVSFAEGLVSHMPGWALVESGGFLLLTFRGKAVVRFIYSGGKWIARLITSSKKPPKPPTPPSAPVRRTVSVRKTATVKRPVTATKPATATTAEVRAASARVFADLVLGKLTHGYRVSTSDLAKIGQYISQGRLPAAVGAAIVAAAAAIGLSVPSALAGIPAVAALL